MARRRHLSRIAVMQVLFERERRATIDPLVVLKRNIEELGEVDDGFAEQALTGILEQEVRLKEIIQQHAPGWTLERMDPISRTVLLIGAYELLHGNDAPPAVVMNEAIEIAKEFSSDEAGKFVNGVLNAIAKGKK
ncbi:MAG: N utilization substance protein B [Candidatus Peregrinibacteria bacterium Gr01-1014_25]|nr:MAG: N utilization substance protein B [Candidatus Peregrinibacteria bacterium Gr01-1014_25]